MARGRPDLAHLDWTRYRSYYGFTSGHTDCSLKSSAVQRTCIRGARLSDCDQPMPTAINDPGNVTETLPVTTGVSLQECAHICG